MNVKEMSPEAKLTDYARRVHFQDEDVEYLLSLLQEARGLGSLAGAAAERAACAALCDELAEEKDRYHWAIAGGCRDCALAIRGREIA